MHNLDSLQNVLVIFLKALLASGVGDLITLGEKVQPPIDALVENISVTISSAVDGWELVRGFAFNSYDAARNMRMIDYMKQLKVNTDYLRGRDDIKNVSYSEGISIFKSKISQIDGNGLWVDLVEYCNRPRATLPVLTSVLGNLKDLIQIPEIEAQKARDQLAKQMQAHYETKSREVQTHYEHAAAAQSSEAQIEIMKELNKSREETAAIGKQLSEFMQIANSDDAIVVTLKKVADGFKKTFAANKSPTLLDLADYMVQCYRVGLNVSMSDVKKYVHALVKEALNRGRKQGFDLDDLAKELEDNYEEGIGDNIVEDFDDFAAFRNMKWQKKTAGKTFESAMDDLVESKNVNAAQRAKLEAAWQVYSTKYVSFGVDPGPIYDKVKALMKRIARGTADSNAVPEALAGICACMALNFAASGGETNPEEIKKSQKNPHPVQVLALFRLLRVDATESWVTSAARFMGISAAASDSHLIQIGTGEGKSIALGVLSIFLALLGYNVDCVCYSEVLSRRDYADFQRLFVRFGIEKNVFYGTFRELSRRNFDEGGKVRDGTLKLLSQTLKPGDIVEVAPVPRILLIDEVDVFFSRDFYGAIYFPAALLQSPEILAVCEFMWKNKGTTMAHVSGTNVYKALIAKFCPAGTAQGDIIKGLIHTELSRMLAALTTYQTSPHRVEGGNLGIVEHGTIKCDLRDGYNTLWWYFQEREKMSITQEVFNANIGLSMTCGNFSYAEIPKSYQRILGVSGTLECLGTFESKIIAQYGIKDKTIMPSMYGKRDAGFDEGIHYEDKLDEYFRKIAHEATTASHVAERATLIFFETEERLKQFMDSQYFPTQQTHVVFSAENLAHYVVNAVKTGRITCFLRVFGRGIDFKCFDKKVAAQGVLVIQTFLSEDVSEEIQIMGRTCRQGDKGTYKTILYSGDLLRWGEMKKAKGRREGSKAKPLVSASDLTAEHKEGLTKFLRSKRDVWFNERSQKRMKDVQKAQTGHQATLTFQKYLTNPTPVNQIHALGYLSSVDRGASDDLHIVFCLDKSGSMHNDWKDLEREYRFFVDEITKVAPCSRVSVIKFDDDAEIAGQNLTVAQARVLNLNNRHMGGTSFCPALQKAFDLFKNCPGFDPCLVFMTDGDNGSENTQAHLDQLKGLHGLQSHFVYFNNSKNAAPEANLKAMATALPGAHFHSSVDLKVAFKAVSNAVLHGVSQV